jgi:hypothetical protein
MNPYMAAKNAYFMILKTSHSIFGYLGNFLNLTCGQKNRPLLVAYYVKKNCMREGVKCKKFALGTFKTKGTNKRLKKFLKIKTGC